MKGEKMSVNELEWSQKSLKGQGLPYPAYIRKKLARVQQPDMTTAFPVSLQSVSWKSHGKEFPKYL